MNRPRLLLFAPLLALAAAAEAAKAPAWVKGADPAYPPDTYLTGVGVGGDLDAARSAARAEISKVFQSRVEQTAVETQTEASSARGKKRRAAELTQEAELTTRVTTDTILEGVQIASVWHDKKRKKHYALAVLNRPKARAALAGQILEKEESIQALLSQAAAAAPVEKARACAQALRLAHERDALAARRRVVDPAVIPDVPGGLSTGEADRALQEALGRIQFVVDAEGPAGSRLKEAVAEKITDLGFKVVESAAAAGKPDARNPVLKAKCRLSVEPFDRGNPSWKFYRWSGSFELTDAATGKTLSSSAPSGSEGHLSEETAKAKTVALGDESLAREAQAKISQHIFGR